jgi:hypothetical protein
MKSLDGGGFSKSPLAPLFQRGGIQHELNERSIEKLEQRTLALLSS